MINLKDFSDRLLTSHLNSIFPSKETTSSRFQKDLLLENVGDNFFLSGKNGLCGVSHSPCFPDLIHHSARIPIPSPSQGPHGQGADQSWHTDLPQEGPPCHTQMGMIREKLESRTGTRPCAYKDPEAQRGEVMTCTGAHCHLVVRLGLEPMPSYSHFLCSASLYNQNLRSGLRMASVPRPRSGVPSKSHDMQGTTESWIFPRARPECALKADSAKKRLHVRDPLLCISLTQASSCGGHQCEELPLGSKRTYDLVICTCRTFLEPGGCNFEVTYWNKWPGSPPPTISQRLLLLPFYPICVPGQSRPGDILECPEGSSTHIQITLGVRVLRRHAWFIIHIATHIHSEFSLP